MTSSADGSELAKDLSVEQAASASQRRRQPPRAPRTDRGAASRRATSIEVYEVEPGGRREDSRYKGRPLALLPADAPLPSPGDLIVLPRFVAPERGEQRGEQPSTGREALIPFRVLECEHLFVPVNDKRHSLSHNHPQPTRYLASWIFVERMGEDERISGDGADTP